ncbi:hypothetical protein FNH04_05910 [Streptomyces phyllanthi]|uniref:Uncharacterized protein n=1 Tax=Streptomyces phyllanthi TaxID=1803180 RepID=A0A5N8VW15_9ACTN|nr:hypothetical protein [Streptomyces phyllanthi]
MSASPCEHACTGRRLRDRARLLRCDRHGHHRAGQPVKPAAKSPVPVARGAEVRVEEALSQTAISVRRVER